MIEFMKSIAKQAGAIALAGQLELQKNGFTQKATPEIWSRIPTVRWKNLSAAASGKNIRNTGSLAKKRANPIPTVNIVLLSTRSTARHLLCIICPIGASLSACIKMANRLPQWYISRQ